MRLPYPKLVLALAAFIVCHCLFDVYRGNYGAIGLRVLVYAFLAFIGFYVLRQQRGKRKQR